MCNVQAQFIETATEAQGYKAYHDVLTTTNEKLPSY